MGSCVCLLQGEDVGETLPPNCASHCSTII